MRAAVCGFFLERYMPVAKHKKFIPEQSLLTKTQGNKTKQTKTPQNSYRY